MHARIATLCLTASAGLLGCSGIPSEILDPELQLQQVVVRGAGLTGGTMDLVVSVYNPNQFDIRGTKLQLGFDVEGSHVGDITFTDEFRVDQGDTTTVVLPMRFNWSGVSAALRAALEYGDIPYKMRGQATVQTPLGARVIPFTREGRAPLTRNGTPTPSATPASDG